MRSNNSSGSASMEACAGAVASELFSRSWWLA